MEIFFKIESNFSIFRPATAHEWEPQFLAISDVVAGEASGAENDEIHSFVYIFCEDFHTYNDERLRHAELHKNYMEDYGYLK
uniref:Uncharacterized protein n=1 Tax=Romanomermis culicivorax TaxID=13658 RepID=A0A915KGB4_ROMCU